MDRDNLIELQNTIIEFQGDIISILMALYIRAPNFYIPDELQSIISRNNALLEILNSPKGEKAHRKGGRKKRPPFLLFFDSVSVNTARSFGKVCLLLFTADFLDMSNKAGRQRLSACLFLLDSYFTQINV